MTLVAPLKDPASFEAALRKETAVAQRIDVVHAARIAAPAALPQAAEASVLHDGVRKLWEDHVSWTRLLVVSTRGGFPDKEALARADMPCGGIHQQVHGTIR